MRHSELSRQWVKKEPFYFEVSAVFTLETDSGDLKQILTN